MMRSNFYFVGLGLMLTSCGDKKGAGTFPDVQTLASKVVPYVANSSISTQQQSRLEGCFERIPLVPFAVSYTENTTSNFSSDRVYVADILGTNLQGVNTQIAVQMAQLKGQVDKINSDYSDADGNPANCTEVIADRGTLEPGGGLKVPFFDTATPEIFWATPTKIEVDPKVACYVATSSGGYNYGMMFGKTAITSPTAGCTDANVYIIVNGYSQLNGTNTQDTANRGTVNNGYQSQVIYYNGCTKDVGIGMSLSTIYPNAVTNANSEFHARFELFGNADTNQFQVRVNKFDANKDTSWGFNSMTGAGKAAGTGNFILSYARYACNNEACATPAVSQATRNYCLALGGSEGSVVVDTTTANCQTHEASFEDAALTPFTSGASTELSRSVLDFSSKTIFGL